MITPSYWPETVIASTVIPTKNERATDSCFTLIGAHQCGVLMGVSGCLVGCLCINHQCKHLWFNKGRQLGRLQTVPGCQGVGLYHTVRQYRQTAICDPTMFCLGECGGDYWFPANTMKRATVPHAAQHCSSAAVRVRLPVISSASISSPCNMAQLLN